MRRSIRLWPVFTRSKDLPVQRSVQWVIPGTLRGCLLCGVIASGGTGSSVWLDVHRPSWTCYVISEILLHIEQWQNRRERSSTQVLVIAYFVFVRAFCVLFVSEKLIGPKLLNSKFSRIVSSSESWSVPSWPRRAPNVHMMISPRVFSILVVLARSSCKYRFEVRWKCFSFMQSFSAC